jgi:hypothetical protein
MNITEHEMRGLITGKAMPADIFVGESLAAYLVRKFAVQQKARDTLAAENAVMLRLLTDISENHVEYFSEGEGYTFAGVPLDYVSEINTYISRDVNAENPFPATDAYLNSVRAEGVEIFAKTLRSRSEGFSESSSTALNYAATIADDFAAQLRAGEPS